LAFLVAVCFFAGGVASLAYVYVPTRLAARIAAAAILNPKFIGPLFFSLIKMDRGCAHVDNERSWFPHPGFCEYEGIIPSDRIAG
jgi:hypothetical protein